MKVKNKISKIAMSSLLVSGILVGANIGTEKADAATIREGTVNTFSLTVRKGTGASYSAIDYLKKGEKVVVEKDYGAWSYVTYGGKSGYVYDKYLTVQYKTTTPSTVTSSKGTIDAGSQRLNVRNTPSTNGKIIGKFYTGWEVNVLQNLGTWLYVERAGVKGYVHKDYVKIATTTTPAPTTPTTPTSGYVVQKGDTLYSISKKFNTTVPVLQKANGLSSTYIKVGQRLAVTGSPGTTPTTPTTPTSPVTNNRLAGKIITLDPGHGGVRSGAVGNGLVEHAVNLDVALRVRDKLEAAGAKVVMTRTTNRDCVTGTSLAVDLACRPNVAKVNHSDIFVSIHSNAGSSTANGAESFYYDSNDKPLASALLNSYVKSTGLRTRSVAYGNLAVLRHSEMPSTLIELGFLSNPSEAAKMKTSAFRDNAANGIYQGILNYFGR